MGTPDPFNSESDRWVAWEALYRAGQGAAVAVITVADASSMTGGSGTFGWFPIDGTIQPTDALAPRSVARPVAFRGGNVVQISGPIPDAQFTTDGGAPRAGQIVWFASGTDDGGTGAGKLTATRPNVSVTGDVSSFSGTFPASPVKAGIVTNASKYATSKTCAIIFAPDDAEPYPPPCAFTSDSDQANGFSNVNYYSAPGNQAGLTLNDGECIAYSFTVDKALTGTGSILNNHDGGVTKGWGTGFSTHVVADVNVTGGGDVSIVLGDAKAGVNRVAIWVADGKLWGCLNGLPIVSGSLGGLAVVPPDATCTFAIGRFPGLPYQGGAIIWAVGLSYTPTASEAVEWTTVYPTSLVAPESTDLQGTFANRLNVPYGIRRLAQNSSQYNPSNVTSAFLPSLKWLWQAGQGTSVFGPDAFTLTLNGVVTTTDFNEATITDVSPLLLDGGAVFYDANGVPRLYENARITFTASTQHPDVLIAYRPSDPRNYDNETGGVFVDGAWYCQFPPPNPGFGWEQTPQNATRAVGITIRDTTVDGAPHRVDVILPSQIQIAGTSVPAQSTECTGTFVTAIGGVAVGQIFDTGAGMTKRLVLGGYDDMSAQDAQLGQNVEFAAVTHFRQSAAVGGVVTSCSAVDRSLYACTRKGVDPKYYARDLFTAAQQGGAATRIVLVTIGWIDYAVIGGAGGDPAWTAVTFEAVLGAALDELHRLDPACIVVLAEGVENQFDLVVNTNGDDYAAFTAAKAAVAATRPWVHFINPRVPGVVAFAGAAPQHVMTTAGIATYVNNILAVLPSWP